MAGRVTATSQGMATSRATGPRRVTGPGVVPARKGPAASRATGQLSQPGQDYGQNNFVPNSPRIPSAPTGQPGSHGIRPARLRPGGLRPAGLRPAGICARRLRAGRVRGQSDYQTEAYPQPGTEPSDYPQNGFGQNGFGQNGFGQNGFSQDPGVTQAYGTQPGYGQNGFAPRSAKCRRQGPKIQDAPGAPNGPRPPTLQAAAGGQGGFRRAQAARPDGHPQDPYTQDQYGAQTPYGRRTPTAQAAGAASRAWSSRGAARATTRTNSTPAVTGASRSRIGRRHAPGHGSSTSSSPGHAWRCAWAAAVVGVVVIVFLVIQLTKSGGNKAATGTSTPTAGHDPGDRRERDQRLRLHPGRQGR